MALSPKKSLVGTTLGPYRVEAELGSGGMGDVYRGVHQELGRLVAIKTLKPDISADTGSLRRFFDEARTVNKIRHENIVDVTDLSCEPDGLSYMIMELLEGRTLTDAIRGCGRMPPDRAVRIAQQIASAISAAHAHQIIHRDLKPDNVFLIRRAGTVDYVKVLDFGIARLHRTPGDATATQTGMLIGTPAYMSPEQAKGEKVSSAADIYALGVILFQMLTGRLPFNGASVPEVMYGHLKLQPPKVSEISPDVPAALTDVVARALAKKVRDRPASMSVMRTELLLAVGLSPADFDTPEVPDEEKRARSTSSSKSSNPIDSVADSMWSGATIDSTGRRRQVECAGPGARAKHVDAKPLAGPPTSNLRGKALDRDRDPHPDARSPNEPQDEPRDESPREQSSADGRHAADAVTGDHTGPAGDTPNHRPKKRPVSESMRAELGSLDTMAPRAGNLSGADIALDSHEQRLRVVAIPTPQPALVALRDARIRKRRVFWLCIAAVALIVGALMLFLPRESGRHDSGPASTTPSDTRPPEQAMRRQLQTAIAQQDEPGAPKQCQTRDVHELQTLVAAVDALRGGSPRSQRANDKRAVASLEGASADTAEYWYWLGKARLYAGSDSAAVREAGERAIDRCAGYAAAHGLMGTASLMDGQWAAAKRHYQRALELDEAFEDARFNLGLAEMGLGRVEEGMALIEHFLTKHPDSPRALLARGQGYLEMKAYDKAVTDLTKASYALPKNARAAFSLGVAYERLGQKKQANDAMCRASQLGYAAAKEFCSTSQ